MKNFLVLFGIELLATQTNNSKSGEAVKQFRKYYTSIYRLIR